MDDVLLGIVLGRLAEFPLPEQAADFLLAALDGGYVSPWTDWDDSAMVQFHL